MSLSDAQREQLTSEAIRAGEINFPLTMVVLRNLQTLVVEVGLEQQPLPAIAITEYAVTVDYSLSIKKAVKAGNYNWSSKNITANNFPVLSEEVGKKDIKFALAHFNHDIEFGNAIACMDKLGYRLATAREILAFGVNYPDLQRQFPIVALGQWANICGDRKVIYLSGSVLLRKLDLIHLFGYVCDDDNYRLLFVHK